MTVVKTESKITKELLDYMETNHLTPQKLAIGLGITEKELIRILDGGKIHPSTELLFKLLKNNKISILDTIKLNLEI